MHTNVNLAAPIGALPVDNKVIKAWGEPRCGVPSRLNRMRSIALASVAVPTVDRGSDPMRVWSTMIAVVRPSRTSTSGRAIEGMKPWTNEL